MSAPTTRQLVEALPTILGIPERDVREAARSLRAAKLLQTGPRVLAHNAGLLLLGLTDTPERAAETVRAYGTMRPLLTQRTLTTRNGSTSLPEVATDERCRDDGFFRMLRLALVEFSTNDLDSILIGGDHESPWAKLTVRVPEHEVFAMTDLRPAAAVLTVHYSHVHLMDEQPDSRMSRFVCIPPLLVERIGRFIAGEELDAVMQSEAAPENLEV